jgi:spoIIIJ-associated protein
VEQAVEKGLTELGVAREKVDVEILNKGGLFHKAEVRLTVKVSEGDKALKFIEELLEIMGVTSVAELNETDDSATVNIIGADIGMLIGYRGEVLDALQYLASLVANKGKEGFKRIVVDGEGYREKRTAILEELADKLAAKAVAGQRPVRTEAMNPYERRVIHSRLTDNAEVDAHSEGDEPNRYLVIVPKGVDPKMTPIGGPEPRSFERRDQGGRPPQAGRERFSRGGGGYNNGGRDGGYNRGGYNNNNGGGGYNNGRRDRDSYASKPDASNENLNDYNNFSPEGAQNFAKKSPSNMSNRQFAFRSSNRRPSPYSNKSGFSESSNLTRQSKFDKE